MHRLLRFLRAGGTWVVVAVLFGLLPLWFRVGHALLVSNAEVGWKDILMDGMLLYFFYGNSICSDCRLLSS
jgi:hypothetical protein